MKISENRELISYVKDFAKHPFSFIGGYPKVLIMRDGGCLCSDCTKSEFKRLLEELRDECDPAWMPLSIELHVEGRAMTCDHCYSDIESAYGDPEQEEV